MFSRVSDGSLPHGARHGSARGHITTGNGGRGGIEEAGTAGYNDDTGSPLSTSFNNCE